MNGCKSPEDLSPFQRLNRMGGDWDTAFDSESLQERLWGIAETHYLSDDELNFLASITAAISGTHPAIRVKVEEIPDGVTPHRLAEWQREGTARAVADQVDMQVANGVKQESAIQDACSRYGVSRREVFRMLREVRAQRLQWQEWDNPYDNYEIAEDGRLVPKENSG